MKQFTLTLVALLILTALTLIPSGGGPAMPGTTAPAGLPASAANQPVTTATPPPSVVRDVPIVSVPALLPKEATDGTRVVLVRPPAAVVVHDARPPLAAADRMSGATATAKEGRIAEPIIGGRATWYPASGMIAAAGPALRHYLGRHWRGTLVSVCHGRCLVVKLSDWCACPRTLLDLSDDAFAQLAPLSRGVIAVSITRAVRVPEPPATDTAP